MKRYLLAGAPVVALALCFGSSALATPELGLVSGASSTTIVGSGSSVTYSNTNFNGWNISVLFGQSNSPSLSGGAGAFGIDLTSLTATCVSGTCSSDPLDVYLSDTGFTQVVGPNGFTTSYSTNQTGGSTTQLAWDDTSNTIFGMGTLIGSVGPFTGSNHGSVSGGGPAGPSAYSLTIEDIFNANGSSATFSTDGSISPVPEPASGVLLGSLLWGAGLLFRKKMKARNQLAA